MLTDDALDEVKQLRGDDRIIAILRALDASRLDCEGGYPAVISTHIPGYVIVASVEEDEPRLQILYWDELREHYSRASLFKRCNRDYTWIEAWYETEAITSPQPQAVP